MAFKSKKEIETSLATSDDMSIPGSLMPATAEEMFSAENGFASIDTLMIGETEGKIPMYVGELLSPGADVEVATPDGGKNKMPTWTFHPITKAGTVTNVTHVIPSAYQLHGAFSRIYAEMTRTGKRAQVGVISTGKVGTKNGKQVNTYRVFEKYV